MLLSATIILTLLKILDMKKLIPLVVFAICFLGFSQEVQREKVNGKIIVEGSDIEGIAIYNTSTNKGTVSDENGEFTIAVKLDDSIEVKALEYQNFNFKVNKFIIQSNRMSIFLIEEINKLDEVVLSNKTLTGDIKTDLNNIKTFSPKLNSIYFGTKNNDLENTANQKTLVSIANGTTHSQAQTMVNGLNIINVVDQLLIPLFRSEVEDKKAVGITEVPATSIKYYLGANFLTENFKIPEHRVEEFIRYVEDDTFDFNMLNYGHEIEFLELLNKRSKTFLATKTGNN